MLTNDEKIGVVKKQDILARYKKLTGNDRN